MILSQEDSKKFYDLIWSLQLYVSTKYKMYDVHSLEEYCKLPLENIGEVRKKLYGDISLFDEYVAKNPDGMSSDDLAIIIGWKRFVKGSFMIERILAKHAIFIGEGNKVYAVVGQQLLVGLKEQNIFPVYVDTVLLPFKGMVIYDGVMSMHSMYFGGGVKSQYKEIYLRAKKKNQIIESFDSDNTGKVEVVTIVDDKVRKEIAELAIRAEKLKATKSSPALLSPAISLIKASLKFAEAVTDEKFGHYESGVLLNKARVAYNKALREHKAMGHDLSDDEW